MNNVLIGVLVGVAAYIMTKGKQVVQQVVQQIDQQIVPIENVPVTPAVTVPVVQAPTFTSTGSYTLLQSPVDPNLIDEGKKILAMLQNMPNRSDHKFISGQMVWKDMVSKVSQDPYQVIEDYKAKTGQYPGLIGMIEPLGNYDNPTAEQFNIDFYNSGGLIMSHILIGHWPTDWYPVIGPGSVIGDTALQQLLTDSRYLEALDHLAQRYLYFQSKGVVFLARPFLEMNGNWMWFYTNNYQVYKNLWMHFVDFMKNKGVHNLLYVYSPDSGFGGYLERYPGSNYVDIVALDYYFSDFHKAEGYDELVSTGKPIAIAEFGQGQDSTQYFSPDIVSWLNLVKQQMPRLVWWMNWSPPFNLSAAYNASQMVNDSWVQNRPVPR